MLSHILFLLCLLQIVVTAAGNIHVPKADGSSAAAAAAFDFISLPGGVTGAESLAFDRRGQGPYAGVSNSRVLKWGGSARGWMTFAYSTSYAHNPSCKASPARPGDAQDVYGRLLGLQFHVRTGDLYIADAYHGLLKVGPTGGEAKSTGDVYFTDISTSYTRRHNTKIMTNRDASGSWWLI
ncbi:hypothetical protein BDA96_08G195500 [Sorghum bicolor]|uniref:Strictosidine synthase conserved region domain-containing protein n=1 Tax=Sorghum bicolor TaxID=4558 RepID=A0A921QJV5_SORBI|nr:hypothetical protein BDA96_08G195500 [Sorghum bicolor]